MNRYLASHFLLKSQLGDVKKALKEIEHFCQHETMSLTQLINSLNPHDADLQYGDEYNYFAVSMPRVIYGAALIVIIAYFEGYLKRTSNMFARKYNLDTLDTQGFGSVRAKLKVFLKQSNFSFSLGKNDWNTIILYWNIRNSIVHAGSKYEQLKAKVQELIDSDPCFHVDRIESTDDQGDIKTKHREFHIVHHKCLDDLIEVILKFSDQYATEIYQHDLSYKARKATSNSNVKKFIISIKDMVLRTIIRCLKRYITK